MNASPVIAVDIGNSAIKLGWFEATAPPAAGILPASHAVWSVTTGESLPAAVFAALPHAPCRWRVSSVHRGAEQQLAAQVRQARAEDDWRVLTYRDLPLEIRVAAPQRVGLDRLAAAVSVNTLREPSRPAIFVGAGSAITVNLLSAAGAFEGGAILPGFRLSAEALARGTDLLPLALLKDEQAPAVLGQDTAAAIRSGLYWGAVGAVREIVARLAESLPQPPQLFVTGGDHRDFAQQLAGDARFLPDLVLAGIALAADHEAARFQRS